MRAEGLALKKEMGSYTCVTDGLTPRLHLITIWRIHRQSLGKSPEEKREPIPSIVTMPFTVCCTKRSVRR